MPSPGKTRGGQLYSRRPQPRFVRALASVGDAPFITPRPCFRGAESEALTKRRRRCEDFTVTVPLYPSHLFYDEDSGVRPGAGTTLDQAASMLGHAGIVRSRRHGCGPVLSLSVDGRVN